MEYKVEEISPVKLKINVTTPAEEVAAALGATAALYRRSADIKGFRKGKVPSSVIEAKFKKQIYSEAANDLINLHLNEIMNELSITPLSRIDMDAEGDFAKDRDYNYSFSFEVAPKFDLPDYEGFEIEQEEAVVDPADVDAVIERLRDKMADLVVLEEDRAAQDKDIVVIDFQALDDGAPIEGISAENFEMSLGESQALPEFENIVKGLKPGETAEKQMSFPADFLNEELAGKTVTMRVTLKSIKVKKLPEADDQFAVTCGQQSMEDLRKAIEDSYMETRKQVVKADAQKRLLDKLVGQVDFPLPEGMVEEHIDSMVEDLRHRLERQGRTLESLEKSPEQLREDFRPDAENMVRYLLFLLAVAAKEDLTVTPQEMDAHFQKMAAQSGRDMATVKKEYEDNNLMFALKDRLLSDKAMELIYSRAKVKEVAPKELGKSGGEKAEATEEAEGDQPG